MHVDCMSKMFCKIDVQYGVVHKENSGIPPYCKYFTISSYCSQKKMCYVSHRKDRDRGLFVIFF